MKNSSIIQFLLSTVLVLHSANSFGAHADGEWTKVTRKPKVLTKAQKARAKQAKLAVITPATDEELGKLATQFSRDIAALEKNLCTLEIELNPSDRAKEILILQALHRKISATDTIRESKYAPLREQLESDISMVTLWQERVADASLRAAKFTAMGTGKHLTAEEASATLAARAATKRMANNRAKQIRKAKAAHQARIAAAESDKK